MWAVIYASSYLNYCFYNEELSVTICNKKILLPPHLAIVVSRLLRYMLTWLGRKNWRGGFRLKVFLLPFINRFGVV